ncbi:hypothetical protein T492DRAFT_1098249 [Pavlovales sp. CCMP2436]|nr:hypothetical protein T492DRAFT_1098249 [Pavlovales sp. CCMP2436]
MYAGLTSPVARARADPALQSSAHTRRENAQPLAAGCVGKPGAAGAGAAGDGGGSVGGKGRAAELQRKAAQAHAFSDGKPPRPVAGGSGGGGKGGLFDHKQRPQFEEAALAEAVLALRSAHAADSEAGERERWEVRTDALGKKEAAALEMEKTCKKRIDATWCEDCNRYSDVKALVERCTAQGHSLQQKTVYKYAHQCGGCGERVYVIDESVHRHKCRKCGVHKWAHCSIYGVDTTAKKSEEEILLTRGVEHSRSLKV